MKLFKHKIFAFLLLMIALILFKKQIHAQDPLTAVPAQYEQYCNNMHPEKMYVHTDKNFYLAGELLWFKIYNVDGSLYQPADMSKIAYVEILDKDNKPVMQIKIALTKGKGNGSFFLPVSINSGNYKLRAYTNWMKNFSPAFYLRRR